MSCLHTSSHLKQGWFSLFASLMSVMGCFVGGGSREHPDSREKPWRALLPEPLQPSGQHGHGHHDGHDKGAGASVTFNPRHVIRNSQTCFFLHVFKGVHRGESRPGEKSHETHRQQHCHSQEKPFRKSPAEEPQQQIHRQEDAAVDPCCRNESVSEFSTSIWV